MQSKSLVYISRRRDMYGASCSRCRHKENVLTDLICRRCGRPLEEVPNVLILAGFLICILLPIFLADNPAWLGVPASYYFLAGLIILSALFQVYILRKEEGPILGWASLSIAFGIAIWILCFEHTLLPISFPDELVGWMTIVGFLVAMATHFVIAFQFGAWNKQSIRHCFFNFSLVFTINVVLISFGAYAWPEQNAYIRDCVVKALAQVPYIGASGHAVVHFFDLGFRYRFALLIGYVLIFMLVRAIREALREPVDMTLPWYDVIETVIATVCKEFVASAKPLGLTWFYVSRRITGLAVPTAAYIIIIALVKLLVSAGVTLSHSDQFLFETALISFGGCLGIWLLSPIFAYAVTKLRWQYFWPYYENQLRGIGRIYVAANLGFFVSAVLLWLAAFVVDGTKSTFSWRDALLRYNNPSAAHMLIMSAIVILIGGCHWLIRRSA
jgi:hypothetical protein